MSAADLRALLASAPSAHRRAVANELGLRPAASADEIADLLRDRKRVAAIVADLPPAARRLAAEAAFFGEAAVHESWSGRPSDAALELERRGLAFPFRDSYYIRYAVPRELHALLADALAAPYGRGLRAAQPTRFFEAPLQVAHDVATLWAYLARSPVRIKTGGAVYQRDVPKLLEALPPLELHGPQDAWAPSRLGCALALMAEEGLVRLRIDERPGGDGRRELVSAGNPGELLGREPERLRASLLRYACRSLLGAPAVGLLNALEPGAIIDLASFGAALRSLCDEVGVGTPEAADVSLAFTGLHFPWLAGAVALGFDRHGGPNAVRAAPPAVGGPGRVICQANFELVALAPPTPSERLVLALACESVPQQAHVFRLTRRSVQAAERTGILDGGVVAAIERVAGELPQSVSRSLADWTSSIRRPVRLRTAMMIDTGDGSTADALAAAELDGYVVERVGPSHLAIRADDVRAVEAALRRAGHELDPGVDRVSGRFPERAPTRTDADAIWEPTTVGDIPHGQQISTLPSGADRLSSVTHHPAPARASALPRTAFDYDSDPVEVVLDALERGTDVFITYAGARGTTRRQITPHELQGAAVRAYCHMRGDDRTFWLASIQDALALD